MATPIAHTNITVGDTIFVGPMCGHRTLIIRPFIVMILLSTFTEHKSRMKYSKCAKSD